MIKLENYKIIKKLASGGMGDVYLAEHTVLETKVAIKSLHSDLVSDEDFRKRFRTEARTQSRLSHPNIVKLIDFQERKNGLFLIMEYVEGKQLNDYIRDVTGPMPDEKLVPLFKEILSAIKYAHSKGLIHRDIKPSNILITDEGKVKIIDFGIAKSTDEDKGLTKAGDQVGTVSYMSPEQVNADKLDILTDIYSLGITLFQMAVGRGPYDGQTNTFKIQTSIVSDPLPNPKEIYPSVSDKLISIIEKSTQKKKEDRYQNCEEFIKSFEKEFIKKVPTNKNKVKIEKTKEIKEKPKKSMKSKNKAPFFIYIILAIIITVLGFQFYNSNILSIEKKSIDKIELDKNKNKEDNKLSKETDPKIFVYKVGKDIYDIPEDELEGFKLAFPEAEEVFPIMEQKKSLELAKLKKQREDKLEQENQTKLKKQREDKLKQDKQAKLEKQKLNKERLDKIEKDKLLVRDENKIYTKYYGGDRYVGKIKNNLMHGVGKMSYSNGDSYDGDWFNGKRNGFGTFKWSDGEVYVGYWKNNNKHGRGSYRYSDGEEWTGNWIDDKQDIRSESEDNGLKTISGVVRNYDGSISGATIKVEGGAFAVSDYSGKFSIRAKIGQVLTISYRGYKDYRYIVQPNISIFSPILIKK